MGKLDPAIQGHCIPFEAGSPVGGQTVSGKLLLLRRAHLYVGKVDRVNYLTTQPPTRRFFLSHLEPKAVRYLVLLTTLQYRLPVK